jgi:hypothetical protein
MKILQFFFLFSAILFIGCADNSSFLTSPDSEFTQQTASPNWVQLPNDLTPAMSIETEYSVSKLIKGDVGGIITLNFNINRPRHEFGNFYVKVKVNIKKNSFPDDEERLFTIAMDPDIAYLNISPSPNTLFKHLTVDWEIKGIDVSDIVPDNLNFVYVGDGNELLETTQEQIIIVPANHKIKVVKAEIYPTSTVDSPAGSRYGFTR